MDSHDASVYCFFSAEVCWLVGFSLLLLGTVTYLISFILNSKSGISSGKKLLIVGAIVFLAGFLVAVLYPIWAYALR